MTLRDYFAAHAPEVPDGFAHLKMQKDENDPPKNETDMARLARWRYFYADSMVSEGLK